MEEFGDPTVGDTGISEATDIQQDGHSADNLAAIELEEMPRGSELASIVDDSSGEVLDEPQYGKSILLFSYLMVIYLTHPPNILCSGGVHGRGTDRRVIRLQFQMSITPAFSPHRLYDMQATCADCGKSGGMTLDGERKVVRGTRPWREGGKTQCHNNT
jgi:hypothetical protein